MYYHFRTNLHITSLFTYSYGKHLFYREYICSTRSISCRNICEHSFNQRWSRSRSELKMVIMEPEWTQEVITEPEWTQEVITEPEWTQEVITEPEWTQDGDHGAGVNSRGDQGTGMNCELPSASTIFAGSGAGPGVRILNKNRTRSRSRIFSFSGLDSCFH